MIEMTIKNFGEPEVRAKTVTGGGYVFAVVGANTGTTEEGINICLSGNHNPFKTMKEIGDAAKIAAKEMAKEIPIENGFDILMIALLAGLEPHCIEELGEEGGEPS